MVDPDQVPVEFLPHFPDKFLDSTPCMVEFDRRDKSHSHKSREGLYTRPA